LPPLPGSDSAEIESPDQNDVVWLFSDFGNDVNTCHLGQSYPYLTYEDVTAVPAVSNLYFVKLIDRNASPILSMHVRNGDKGKPPTVNNTKTLCPGLPVFKSHNSDRYVKLLADVSPEATSDRMALIKKILLSISY